MTTKSSPRFDMSTITRNRLSKRPCDIAIPWGDLVELILLNDNHTDMMYVVRVLVKIFEMSESVAKDTMMMAHVTGDAFIGLYSRDLAEELLGKVRKMNQTNGKNLRVEIDR